MNSVETFERVALNEIASQRQYSILQLYSKISRPIKLPARERM
jgi:hypothetical protein